MKDKWWRSVDMGDLVGKTILHLEREGDEEIQFVTKEGDNYRMMYHPDCCAQCSIEEIHGDLNDLLESPVLMAEEVSSTEPDDELKKKRAIEKETAEKEGRYYYDGESETWTFYKIATIKGSVTIRWYGTSNGYYSESASFEKLQ